MAVSRREIVHRIETIVFEEQRSIRRDVAATQGGLNFSSTAINELTRVIIAGMRRANARIVDEVCTSAGNEARKFADEISELAKALRVRVIGLYRQQLMSDRVQASPEEVVRACKRLSQVLRRECDDMIGDVRNRAVLLSPDLVVQSRVPTEVTSVQTIRKGRPNTQSLDISALPKLLLEVRSAIGASHIDRMRQRALQRQITAIEALANRPNAHQGMLITMVRRLPPALKIVRLEEAEILVENFIRKCSTLP